jgi:hypothetical protein
LTPIGRKPGCPKHCFCALGSLPPISTDHTPKPQPSRTPPVPISFPFSELQEVLDSYVTLVVIFPMKLGSTPRQFTLSLEGPVASPPPLDCSHSQKTCILSPLFATLTHSASRKSFPCHSCENTGDGIGISSRRLLLGSTGSPLATRHSPLASFPLFARSFALSFLATSADSAHYASFSKTPGIYIPKANPRRNSRQYLYGQGLSPSRRQHEHTVSREGVGRPSLNLKSHRITLEKRICFAHM